MSSFGRNNNSNSQQAPNQAATPVAPAKDEQPNKVKFSSVKMGETKQGSPTVGIYLKRDQLEKLVALGTELLQMGEDGCKLSCIIIPGEKYDSGYAYVNPKEKRQDGPGSNQGQSRGFQGGGNGGYRKQNAGANDRTSAKAFFASKRVDDGEAQG